MLDLEKTYSVDHSVGRRQSCAETLVERRRLSSKRRDNFDSGSMHVEAFEALVAARCVRNAHMSSRPRKAMVHALALLACAPVFFGRLDPGLGAKSRSTRRLHCTEILH